MENNFEYLEKAFLEAVDDSRTFYSNDYSGKCLSDDLYLISLKDEPVFTFSSHYISYNTPDLDGSEEYFFIENLIEKYFFRERLSEKYNNIVEFSVTMPKSVPDVDNERLDSAIYKEADYYQRNNDSYICFDREYYIDLGDNIKKVAVYNKSE